MTDKENFGRLVGSLSLDERHNLLEKLKDQSVLSDSPLYIEDKSTVSTEGIEAEYSKLAWYNRFWYFLLSFFKSKSPVKIFEDYQVSILGNRIEESTPGLYNYHNGMLQPVFYRQMTKLKDAAHFFYSALDTSVNRDRGAFFGFLGSLEMPEIHKQLERETNPNVIIEKHPDTPETELRSIAFRTMDDAMMMINEDHRNAMYFNARSLFCLKELSSFLYDRVIMVFSGAANAETCSAGVVRELLLSLNNILFSLRVVPPMTLLESLFVFILQERAVEPGFDIHREIRSLLKKAEGSLAVIREFNKQVPLTWILRCSTRNMGLAPRETSGGEDWFVTYRDHWKRRVESLCIDYLKDYRQRQLLDSFRHILKNNSLKILAHTQNDSTPDGLPIRGAFALAFLYTFYPVVFMPDINWILRPILINGDFQKKENRIEFTEAYNNLIKLEDEIKRFEQKLSPAGDYGERYAQARQEMSALPVKRRKLQIVTDEAEEEVRDILERAHTASLSMVNILGGILGKDPRGKYFTLSNLSKVAGKDDQFITGIDEAIQIFQTVLKLLGDIETMESGR